MIHSKPLRSVIAVALVAGATACHSTPADAPEKQEANSTSGDTTATTKSAGSSEKVDGAQAKQLVSQGAFLLDVRTPEEFAAGHVEGATNIPVQVLSSRMSEVPQNNAVVVYCQSGRRSASAAEMLKDAGYEVHDLGPMSAW